MSWSRRSFLKASGISLFAAATGGVPGFLERTVRATGASMNGRRRTLVAIFQRGAMDGFMAVPSLGDGGAAKLRPRLVMSPTSRDAADRPLDLGVGYGLHPAMGPLMPLFSDGRLAIVHGVGSPNPTRSHFDAQDFMETGTPFRKGTGSGWMNRALGIAPSGAGPFRAVSITGSLPMSLTGIQTAIAVQDLERLKVGDGRGGTSPLAASFERLYAESDEGLLVDRGAESFAAMRAVAESKPGSYRPENGAEYPRSPLGRSLQQIAFLIKAQLGLEMAFAESDGWDTHVQQGRAQGAFANRARDLSSSIAAFWRDLGGWSDEVLLITMTEFGRTVHENGSGGTDHGRGSCLFVLGERVDGGKVHGSIPELSPSQLEDGRDLPVAVDFRRVFAEVASGHLGVDDDAALFPGWDGSRLPLMRA